MPILPVLAQAADLGISVRFRTHETVGVGCCSKNPKVEDRNPKESRNPKPEANA
jgi:hypothetical protein